MRYSELKIRKEPPYNPNINNEARFIFMHGWYNCRILRFKNASATLKILKSTYPELILNKKEKHFILKHSNKDVLCHVHNRYSIDDNQSIIVYGDNNIVFPVECFI